MPDGWTLTTLSLAELRALRRRLDCVIEVTQAEARHCRERHRAAAQSGVVVMLASSGLEPHDMHRHHVLPTLGRKLPPKFRDPTNAENIWSGRGSKPRSFDAALRGGTLPGVMLIGDG